MGKALAGIGIAGAGALVLSGATVAGIDAWKIALAVIGMILFVAAGVRDRA